MGLRLSHGEFEMAYSAFNRFRGFVLKSIGGSWPPHENKDLVDGFWYWGENSGYSSKTHKGLLEFFCHSDCDEDINPEMCKIIADELESILPYISLLEEKNNSAGHILARGGYVQVTKDFIEACREAHRDNEPLVFG